MGDLVSTFSGWLISAIITSRTSIHGSQRPVIFSDWSCLTDIHHIQRSHDQAHEVFAIPRIFIGYTNKNISLGLGTGSWGSPPQHLSIVDAKCMPILWKLFFLGGGYHLLLFILNI